MNNFFETKSRWMGLAFAALVAASAVQIFIPAIYVIVMGGLP